MYWIVVEFGVHNIMVTYNNYTAGLSKHTL